MDDYTPNELAYLDLINDISKAFCFVGEEWEPAICDGDMKSCLLYTSPSPRD